MCCGSLERLLRGVLLHDSQHTELVFTVWAEHVRLKEDEGGARSTTKDHEDHKDPKEDHEGMPDWRKEFWEKSKLYAELAKHPFPWKPVEKHIGLNVTGVSHVYFAVTKKELEAGIHPNMHFTDGKGHSDGHAG